MLRMKLIVYFKGIFLLSCLSGDELDGGSEEIRNGAPDSGYSSIS